jgi:hypothetical protein
VSTVSKLTHSEKILAPIFSAHIYLTRGTNQGKPAWYYVAVWDDKLDGFFERTQGGSLNLADYGFIIYSGFGQDPPKEIVNLIEDSTDSLINGVDANNKVHHDFEKWKKHEYDLEVKAQVNSSCLNAG